MSNVDRELTEFKVHLPNLFKEVLNNAGTSILNVPLKLTLGIMEELAELAVRLDNPELNVICLRLALFEQGNPESKDYDPMAIRNQRDRIKNTLVICAQCKNAKCKKEDVRCDSCLNSD